MSEGLTEEEFKELKERLRQEFSDYYEKAGGKDYRFFHLKFVFKAVQRLAEDEEISGLDFDRRVLEVAALFHDIGRSEDIENGFMDPFEGHEGHAARGAEIVSEYTSDIVSNNQLRKIEEVIKNHHSNPETVEGEILQDADDLAKYGVSDIWRMIHYASEEDMDIEEGFENFRNTLKPRLKEGLEEFNFNISKSIAKSRMRKQVDFINRMEKEMVAEDF